MGKGEIDPRAILLNRAGITPELLEAGEVDQQFEFILEALGTIHRGKEALYGNYLETHGDEPTNFALVQHFCDLKRKYVRAETFVKKRLDGQHISLEEMLDTYADLAVYGAMGVQLVLHLINRGTDADTDGTGRSHRFGRSFGGRAKGGVGDHDGGGSSGATGVPPGPFGGGSQAASRATTHFPGGPESGPHTALEVKQEPIQDIAERYRKRSIFRTNQSSAAEGPGLLLNCSSA